MLAHSKNKSRDFAWNKDELYIMDICYKCGRELYNQSYECSACEEAQDAYSFHQKQSKESDGKKTLDHKLLQKQHHQTHKKDSNNTKSKNIDFGLASILLLLTSIPIIAAYLNTQT